MGSSNATSASSASASSLYHGGVAGSGGRGRCEVDGVEAMEHEALSVRAPAGLPHDGVPPVGPPPEVDDVALVRISRGQCSDPPEQRPRESCRAAVASLAGASPFALIVHRLVLLLRIILFLFSRLVLRC